MKKTVTLLASLLIALTAGAQTINVHMTDGTVVNYPLANVNYIDFTASATPDPEPGTAPEGVVAVDLGLPSGTKWANMNVGAKKVEDYGLYFAWGETVGYTSDTSDGHVFDWASYKWCNGSYTTLTKYCTKSSYGTVDNKTVLDLEDDAAYMNWGSAWRMPTKAEVEELLNNTTSTWTTVNGVKGRRFTSKTNGNSIFLPAAGDRWGSGLDLVGSDGYYRSSSLDESFPYDAYYLNFSSGGAFYYYGRRSYGRSVRPVRPGTAPEGVVAVDLGLPSGTKWANMNVGAQKIEDYGLYFAWGETVGYTSDGRSFDWASYKWCNGSYTTLTKYCTEDSYGTVDNKTVLDLEDDAAYVNWGSAWRMPTKAEVEELLNNTTSTWTTVNGVKGRRFTSKTNGNSIFLPAAGYRWSSDLYRAGSYGYYWSSSLNESGPSGAYDLYFLSGNAGWNYDSRHYGQSVRPVRQN